MAKFTATVPLKMKLPGGFEIDGAAGATHRIPDALYEEFHRDHEPSIPGGVTWITQDETSNIPTLPMAQANVSGLTSDLAAKFDKTGGTISGAVTVTGAISAASVSASGITASGQAQAGSYVRNGGGFTNSFDTDVWIAGSVRSNPTTASQGYYGQHRVTGNAGSVAHDAGAFELRLSSISNPSFLNAFEASVVVTGGANTIPDMRAITANVTISNGVSGSVTQSRVIAAQTIVNASTATVGTAYGIYADPQTAGLTNYNIYAPTGSTHLGILETEGDATVGVNGTGARKIVINGASGQVRDIVFKSGGVDRWYIRCDQTAESGSQAGSDLTIFGRSDAGGANVTSLTITRSTGGIGIGNVPIGFFGTTPQTKKTVSGSRGGNAALASLITQLAAYGIITDGSSA